MVCWGATCGHLDVPVADQPAISEEAHVIADDAGRTVADILTFPDWVPVEVSVYVRIVSNEIQGVCSRRAFGWGFPRAR